MTCQAAVACSWYRTCLRRVCGGRAIVTQTNVTCRRASQPAALRVFLPWQVPRNNIATPSLLGRSQTTQVRCLCVAQVGAHVRARASSQYACALHSTTCPRIASCSHSALQKCQFASLWRAVDKTDDVAHATASASSSSGVSVAIPPPAAGPIALRTRAKTKSAAASSTGCVANGCVSVRLCGCEIRAFTHDARSIAGAHRRLSVSSTWRVN